MANDLNINWKDGVGEVTDQPLTVSPGSGAGSAPVSFGSVMNNGLDRTLELEITTPKGVKKTLTVNQEGCRQAYITSDGKRWLTSDNRVYGVLKAMLHANARVIALDILFFTNFVITFVAHVHHHAFRR